MAAMAKAASALLLLSLLFFVAVVLSSTSRSMVSASSTAASSRALARREALLRAAGSQSGLDHAAQSRNRRKRAAMARRGAIVAGDSSSNDNSNLDQFEFSNDKELLLEQEFQRQLDPDSFGDNEFGVGTSGSASSSTAAAAAKPVTADSSFTSTYGVPPPRDAATTAATAAAAATATTAAAATTATTATTASSSAAARALPHADTTTTTTTASAASKKPLDDIFVVINTPHYLGDGYAAPVEGCKRTVKAERLSSSPTSPSSTSSSTSSSSELKTIPLRCEFSADTSKVRQAHALWYHLPNTGPVGPYADLPRADNGGNPFTARPATEQVAVAATMESAAYYPNILDPGFMRHFAVESSYRLRSDAMLTYFGEPHVQLWTNLSSIKSFGEKKVFFCFLLFALFFFRRCLDKTLSFFLSLAHSPSLTPLFFFSLSLSTAPHRPPSATSRPTAAPPRAGTASSEN